MTRSDSKSDPLNGLTPIHQPIHCAATNDSGGALDEVGQIQVNHFLQTLARIALAVATRQADTGGTELG